MSSLRHPDDKVVKVWASFPGLWHWGVYRERGERLIVRGSIDRHSCKKEHGEDIELMPSSVPPRLTFNDNYWYGLTTQEVEVLAKIMRKLGAGEDIVGEHE